MAHIGKRHQGANGGKDFRNHPVGGVEVIRANVFPNLVKVETASGWKSYPVMNRAANVVRRRSFRGNRPRSRRREWASPVRFSGRRIGC